MTEVTSPPSILSRQPNHKASLRNFASITNSSSFPKLSFLPSTYETSDGGILQSAVFIIISALINTSMQTNTAKMASVVNQ